MCTLCFIAGERPKVYAACQECHGLDLDGRCRACNGRGVITHRVSFECECDGCKEFRGEPHPEPVFVAPNYLEAIP